MSQKIGAVQVQDIQGDTSSAMAVISRYMAEADRHDLDVICFPECFLQGYTLDVTETKTRGISLDSPQFRDILQRLSEYKAAAILGIIEEEGGRYFNSAVVIKQGKLIGVYRKVHLFEKNFGPGTQYPVFTVDGLTFGINICYDARFPEGPAEMVGSGAKVIFYPLNNRLPAAKANGYRYKHLPNLVDRAVESKCWVVSSDIIHRDTESIGYGCSAIVSPSGDVVQRIAELETGMIVVEL